MTTAYETLVERFATIADIEAASAILGWDKSTIMPEGGAQARAAALATLAALVHEKMTDPEMADLLDAAEADEHWAAANLAEMRRSHRLATALPADLVHALSLAESDAEMTWRSARRNDDFAALAPKLETLIGLVREQAAALADGRNLSAYDALLDLYDPGRRSADIDRFFADLAGHLPPLLDAVIAHQDKVPAPVLPEGPFPVAYQKQLGEAVMTTLGFDFNRGRLDTSHHPFSGGLPDDSRITTRYDEDDFTTSLMAVIHETGHALYEQGRPAAWRRQPVGRSGGMTLHESQSLFFEMQAGRSRPFLAFLAPLARDAFGGSGAAWDADNITRLYHTVSRGLIRVDADEVSYPLHVILRYRLETALISGDLAVADLPAAWNAGMADLVGIAPPDDRDGCLQDIHWPAGAFGYFPTYTLGAMAAAQLFQAAERALPDFHADLARGDVSKALVWLRSVVHEKGRSASADDIIEAATGAPLGTEALKTHLKARYLDGL